MRGRGRPTGRGGPDAVARPQRDLRRPLALRPAGRPGPAGLPPAARPRRGHRAGGGANGGGGGGGAAQDAQLVMIVLRKCTCDANLLVSVRPLRSAKWGEVVY